MSGNVSARFEFPGAYGGQVTLTFDASDAVTPGYVLVLPWWDGKLVLTRHRTRGWEVPGGTIELGEMPIQAAIRETYEETGAELEAIEWIGQYSIVGERADPMVKSVYIARVKSLHPLPPDFETEEVRVCEELPDPKQVRTDAAYSPIMRDDVYPLVLARINELQHPYAKPIVG